ncbi:TBC1 domain family member 15 [Camellia lanceoleosa]|uniref:TBC1 domain family member 15 n=1 Tax=Camellia lanceoleosa TaxID=1840588 RepID=A0ACC0J0N9_9ERIC|nr:TBC1 domain family member 15 [Camellia lanceoleosa]
MHNNWLTFIDSEGRIIDSKALRKRIFYGGVDPGLRKEVWPFLLGYHAYDSTSAEREYLMSLKKSSMRLLKPKQGSISTEQAKRFTKFRERKALLIKMTDRSLSFYDGDDNPNVNLLRDILLTYSFYNFDLGYCQYHQRALIFVTRSRSWSFVERPAFCYHVYIYHCDSPLLILHPFFVSIDFVA